MRKRREDSFVPFLQTDRQLVEQARRLDGRALNELLSQYRGALYSYVRRKYGLDAAAAEDLLQDFLTRRVVNGDLLAQFDPARGKFRSFLATSLDHFLIDRLRGKQGKHQQAERGLSAEEEPGRAAGPDAARLMDLAWAEDLFLRCEKLMRQEWPADWELLEARFFQRPAADYATLRQQFGFTTHNQVTNALRTAQNRFRRVLEELLDEHGNRDGDTTDEIRELFQILDRGHH
jgi:RNA polymerase sigma factor (sigma-70 family)